MRALLLSIIALAVTVPAAADILYTCDSSIGMSACSALNNLVPADYKSIFGNSVSANIYITYANVGVGASSTNYTPVPYSTYYTALAANTNNPNALASLGSSGDPLGAQSDGMVDISPALANSLGITANGANTAGLESDGMTNCTLGASGCYNGVIFMTSAGGFYFPSTLTAAAPAPLPYLIDFYSVVEHETDEVLGTVSCIGGTGGAATNLCDSMTTDASAADLFRYSAGGTRTFLNSANGTTAYFSTDGGVTDIADYNNSPSGGDYGDWLTIYPYLVQDAEVSLNTSLDISTDFGVNGNNYPQPEVAVLNAVGFHTVAPEPSTFGLIGVGLMSLAYFGGLRRR
jgi:hypothetical protein